jgi:hypothetical protein
MDYESLLDEVTEQWGGRSKTAEAGRFEVADLLAEAADIAWRSLAHPPNEEEQILLYAAAQMAGTRSSKPRTVLRKLIEHAEREHGWVPTEGVLRAAGRKVPA